MDFGVIKTLIHLISNEVSFVLSTEIGPGHIIMKKTYFPSIKLYFEGSGNKKTGDFT